jgi:hypothetical protein
MSIDDAKSFKVNSKRFWERWIADPLFRNLLKKNPHLELKNYGIVFSEKSLKKILSQVQTVDINEAHNKLNAILFSRNKVSKDLVLSPDSIFSSWLLYRFKKQAIDQIPLTLLFPFAIELTKGCSSGCKFCGLSAKPLCGIYTYDSVFWKEILQVLKKHCGIYLGRHGFCYWATDPFDNPEYEKFFLDFFKIFKTFPCTTTSQFTKDIRRSKNFIKLIKEIGEELNLRGSILSFHDFNILHQKFSAQELENFQVLFQFNNLLPIIKAGRARDLEKLDGLLKIPESKSETIACVSGFLLNMVEKSIKLIIPCKADNNWPFGYQILSERVFHSSDDLDRIIQKMINVDMIKDMVKFVTSKHPDRERK